MRPLDRFKRAQDSPDTGYHDALREIRGGGKRGHWVWYIFPQLSGLGSSSPATRYAVADVGEAIEYLRDETLRDRLLTITTAVAEQLRVGISLTDLMGSPLDARKLVSSLTLFDAVAHHLVATRVEEQYRALTEIINEVLAGAAAEGYPRCSYTAEQLDRWRAAALD